MDPQSILDLQSTSIGIIWHLATLGNKYAYKRLQKREITRISIPEVCNTITKRSGAPGSIRIYSNLMFGVSLAHRQQMEYLYNETTGIKKSLQSSLFYQRSHSIFLSKPNFILPITQYFEGNDWEIEDSGGRRPIKHYFLTDDPAFDISRDFHTNKLDDDEADIEIELLSNDDIHNPSLIGSSPMIESPRYVDDGRYSDLVFDDVTFDIQQDQYPFQNSPSPVEPFEPLDLMPVDEALPFEPLEPHIEELELDIEEQPQVPAQTTNPQRRKRRTPSRPHLFRLKVDDQIVLDIDTLQQQRADYKELLRGRYIERRAQIVNLAKELKGGSVLATTTRFTQNLTPIRRAMSDDESSHFSDIEMGRNKSRSNSIREQNSISHHFQDQNIIEEENDAYNNFADDYGFATPEPHENESDNTRRPLSLDISITETLHEYPEMTIARLDKKASEFYDHLQEQAVTLGRVYDKSEISQLNQSQFFERLDCGTSLAKMTFEDIAPSQRSNGDPANRSKAALSFLYVLQLASKSVVQVSTKGSKPSDINIIFNC